MDYLRFPAFIAGLLVVALADAQGLSSCHDRPDPMERLACYDRLSGYVRHEEARPKGILAERWGYDSNAAASRFRISQQDVNYVALSYSDARNTTPRSPSHPDSGNYPAELNPLELSFQLSAKARVFDLGTRDPDRYDPRDHNFGIWLAYTQQSFWQAFNAPQSRPFRETNYQPEVILAIRPDLLTERTRFDDVVWRVFNIGFAHQSNGQSDPLSRSWNRVYAQLGFERSDPQRGDWAVLLRPWYRFREKASKDDNPDITDYLGHGDVQVLYRKGGFALSATGRVNLRTGKGAGTLDFSFPLSASAAPGYPLKWYVRLFSGYGESLIDYNKRQTTLSVGFTLGGEH
ncbi:MAG TPA: phospholipase A [Casimicrobiaceae bacterium]